jgi:hypothetical protein
MGANRNHAGSRAGWKWLQLVPSVEAAAERAENGICLRPENGIYLRVHVAITG